jgi:hypothetical protein
MLHYAYEFLKTYCFESRYTNECFDHWVDCAVTFNTYDRTFVEGTMSWAS